MSLNDIVGNSFTHVPTAPELSDADRELIAAFTRLYYRHWHHDHPGGRGSVSIGWLGHLAQKCPTDIWTCQEIIAETKPDLIIETGSCLGGSGMFMAMICELLGRGEIISIDIDARDDRPSHPRLQFLPEALLRLTGLTLQVLTSPDRSIVAPPSTQVDEPRKLRITPRAIRA